MSNLEEDIKFIEEMIKEYKTFGDLHNPDFEDTDRIYKALENMLKRIKELEEENKIYVLNGDNVNLEIYIKNNYIPVQKVKNILTKIQEEFNKLDKTSDEFLNSKEKTVEDYILEKERLATMQTLAYCRDNLEELLEEK